MTRKHSIISIFEYADYRVFLKDWFQAAKKERRGISFRWLAKKASFHTSNFLLLVIQGKRNLTEQSTKQISGALELNKQEGEFFRNLVSFNQATSLDERNISYQLLMKSKKYREMKPIEKKKYEYYSAWYHPVVRELVAATNFDGTPEWIANRLVPRVTSAHVSKSIELLETLGLIEKVGPGKWKQSETILSTGPEVYSVVIHNYHKHLLDLSKEMMDALSIKYRDTSAMTLGVRRDKLAPLQEKIRNFRREILTFVADQKDPEEVIQLNIQYYPVTKVMDKGGV